MGMWLENVLNLRYKCQTLQTALGKRKSAIKDRDDLYRSVNVTEYDRYSVTALFLDGI